MKCKKCKKKMKKVYDAEMFECKDHGVTVIMHAVNNNKIKDKKKK